MNNRFLFIVGYSLTASPATAARFVTIGRAIAQMGYRVDIVTIEQPGLKLLPDSAHVYVSRLPSIGIPNSLIWRVRLNAEVRRYARRNEMGPGDVVWAFDNELEGFRLAGFLRKRFPGVTITHEITEHPAIWSSRAGKVAAAYLCRSFIPRADAIMAISSSLVELSSYHGARRVILTGPITEIGLSAEKIRPEVGLVAYAGDINEHKDGVRTLVRSIRDRLRADVGDGGANLLLIGSSTNPEDVESIRAYVCQEGLESRVRMVGRIPRDEALRLLRSAEVLVIPRPYSLQAEFGFPTKLGEYLETGRPVVTTDVGDIKFRLQDRTHACVVPASDDVALSEAIGWCLDNQNEAQRMAERGNALVRNGWSSDVVVPRIIRELL